MTIPPACNKLASRAQSEEKSSVHTASTEFDRLYTNHSVTNVPATKDPYERLRYAGATAAFHGSAQYFHPPECRLDTKLAVQQSIMDWVMSNGDRVALIMWLYGAAGAGKSAIVLSIAELCAAQGIPVATFFFLRTDSTRNDICPVVATLALQLAITIPASRDYIFQAIDHDPLLFKQSFQYQFDLLIISPLRRLGQRDPSSETSKRSPSLIILIDGLDQCDDPNMQTYLIHTLAEISTSNHAHLLFLIASRPEPHLALAFNSKNTSNISGRLALDNMYRADDDIRRFLIGEFAGIRDTHPLRHLLDPDWPARSRIDALVQKSTGQFIYVTVVMSYISSPNAHPGCRLNECCNLCPAGPDVPFAQLDVLYHHILSQAHDMNRIRPLLAFALYGSTHIYALNVCLGLMRGTAENILSELESIISCEKGRIEFVHTSLPDFLCDRQRSGQYYIDPGWWCAYLGVAWLQNHTALDADLLHVTNFLQRADPTPELRRSLFKLAPKFEEHGAYLTLSDLFGLVSVIRTLGFNDGGKIYDCIFIRTARYLKANFPTEYHQLLQQHSPMPPKSLAKIEMQASDIFSRIKGWMKLLNWKQIYKQIHKQGTLNS